MKYTLYNVIDRKRIFGEKYYTFYCFFFSSPDNFGRYLDVCLHLKHLIRNKTFFNRSSHAIKNKHMKKKKTNKSIS